MYRNVLEVGVVRLSCVVPALIIASLLVPLSSATLAYAAESAEVPTPAATSAVAPARTEPADQSGPQVMAAADALAAQGKHAEAVDLLDAYVKDHRRDQQARAHLLELRVAQKETEIRSVLQEQSDSQGLIATDPEYQALAARSEEDVRKRLAVVEYFLTQNRLNEAAQGCNAILRDHPKDPATMRLKFRILNTVVERERKELNKEREYRRGEAMNDVTEDAIFPRDQQRTQRQVFIFQEDIDDVERTKVRARLQERISLNQDQAKVWDVMKTLFAVAGINYVVLDSAVGEETVSLHLIDDTVESALNAVGKLAKVRFSYTDGTVFVSSDADDGLVTEIIRLRSGLTNVGAEVNASTFGAGGQQNAAGGAGGANGAANNIVPPGLPPQVQQALRNQQNRNGAGGAANNRGANGQQGQPGQNGQANTTQSDLEKFLTSLPDIIVGWQDTHKWHLDQKSNTLYLRANPWVISEVKRLLHALDYNNVQILIESKFIEVSESAERQLGVDWGAFQGAERATANWAAGVGVPALPSVAAAPALASGLLQQSGYTLNVTIKALEKEGQLDTLAEPKILTLNNANGYIETIRRDKYVSSYTFNSINTNATGGNINNNTNVIQTAVPTPVYEDAESGYQLKITPSVARNSPIVTLRLKPTVQETDLTPAEYPYQPSSGSGVVNLKIAIPSIRTRTLETVLHIDNGRTVALGGLSLESQQKDTAGTPFVSKIPVLGWLFKSERTSSSRRNLIILVTANIVEPTGAKVGDNVAHLRDTARILLPSSGVLGMEPAQPVMIEPSRPAGPVAQPNPLRDKGRRP